MTVVASPCDSRPSRPVSGDPDLRRSYNPANRGAKDTWDPATTLSEGDPTLQDVLLAISASRVTLEGKIDALASDLMVLMDDHRRLAEKVTTTDKQLEELRPEIKDNTNMT
ncbi:hypothetical protein NDU88_009149 [Pleurodeles waltl]|uniref:Uncharacterized protein n=1 Tax=Pleurodeles waltl TaxID=8319 RepID=A0AAV7RY81_PLEWA|nr:hypothetical protein NDU88_009149 [Pleurodeles waltl]